MFNPEAYVGHTHVTEPERAALRALEDVGLHDVVRDRWPNEERVFSYWDYRAGMFHQDLGMRIDLILAGDAVSERVKAAWIDREARKGSGPSDHAPVIVDLDDAPDGDIGPVVPPASAPAPRGAKAKLPQSDLTPETGAAPTALGGGARQPVTAVAVSAPSRAVSYRTWTRWPTLRPDISAASFPSPNVSSGP